MSIDRREQERFSLNLQAKITGRQAGTESPIISTLAADISSGGAFIETDHPFPMASRVEVEFYLSIEDLKKLKFILSMESLRQLTGSHIWVKTSGVVIRRNERGVAIIFDTDYQLTPMTSPD